jgi:hypothetical protein
MTRSAWWSALATMLVLAGPPVAHAQLDLEKPQAVSVSGRGFYPFSSEANAALHTLLETSPAIGVVVTAFDGKKLKLAPAADGREIGKRKTVRGETAVALSFRKTGTVYGLSFVPRGPVTMIVDVQPFAGRPCPSLVRCQDDCGGNLGKCCEKDASGIQTKICVQVGTSSCGCGKK